MDTSEYHADTSRISATGLRYLHRSPAHYFANFLSPNRIIRPPTPAMILGTTVHCAILEPERFSRKYVCVADDEICKKIGTKNPRSTAEYKAWLKEFRADNADKEIVSLDDYNTVIDIRDAVWSHSHASKLLENVTAEKSIFFTDTDSGAMCKIRPDAIDTTSIDTPIIIELKTCENATPSVFGRQAINFGYHNQAALYVNGLMESGMSIKQPLHIFIAVEKEPPYAVALYYTPDRVLELGRYENAIDLKTYVDCINSGVWKGYNEELTPLQIPEWTFRQFK